MRPLVVRTAFYLPHGGRRGASLSSAGHHLAYMTNPDKDELLVADAAIHARYMAHRPGSAGAFGPDPRMLVDVREAMETITTHRGPVWRMIVSVHEDDALAMGGELCRRAGWELVAREVMPQIAARMGIGAQSCAWVAAVHRTQNTEANPHLHLLFWQTTATREKGHLSAREMQAVRELWMKSLYRPERVRLGAQKTAARTHALRELQRALADGALGSATDTHWLATRLERLGAVMPHSGTAALAFVGDEARVLAFEVVDELLHRLPALGEAAAAFEALAEDFQAHDSGDPERRARAGARARRDLRERLAQQVIREARTWQRHGQGPSSITPWRAGAPLGVAQGAGAGARAGARAPRSAPGHGGAGAGAGADGTRGAGGVSDTTPAARGARGAGEWTTQHHATRAIERIAGAMLQMGKRSATKANTQRPELAASAAAARWLAVSNDIDVEMEEGR